MPPSAFTLKAESSHI
ncbi:hypothetical protein CIB84_017288 [Bambusicola thoracicus]|uniref:Uncharacterized protein n=1 Tax=Bambusicola thoracicus TaxID=9083 RepID=A0A2P4S4E8_BAMTH|nr:hypothetical protein CIB84_017288 [Bambusicola thoracicus]